MGKSIPVKKKKTLEKQGTLPKSTSIEKKLSVAIITYNEERNIRDCIESCVNVADEIVILDSISTDKPKDF